MSRLRSFFTEETGPSTVEYALLLGLIVLVSVETLGVFGTRLHSIYTSIDTAMPD